MNKLTWIFEIFDKGSAPAKAMGCAVGKLGDAFRRAGSESHGFMAKLQDLFFIKEAIGLVGHLTEKLREYGSEILAGVAFRQNSLIALKALSGTRDKAIQIFEGVEDFAWKTGQSVQNVMASTKNLLTANFDPSEVRYIQQLVGDLNLIDSGKASSVEGIISDIGRLGKMTSRQFMQLKSVTDVEAVWTEMSKIFGKPVEQLKAMEERGFAARDAVQAITNVLLKKYSKGSAGSLLEQQAKTIPALLQKVRGIPERIMDELAGFGGGTGSAFARFLENVAETFDPTGPSGKRIVDRIREFVDRVAAMFGFGGGGDSLWAELTGPNGPRKIEEIFDRIVAAVERAIPKIIRLADAMGKVLGYLTDLVNGTDYSDPDSVQRMYGKGAKVVPHRTLTPEPQGPERAAWLKAQQAGATINANFSFQGVKAEDAEEIRKGVEGGLTDLLERAGLRVGAFSVGTAGTGG